LLLEHFANPDEIRTFRPQREVMADRWKRPTIAENPIIFYRFRWHCHLPIAVRKGVGTNASEFYLEDPTLDNNHCVS
jgi:hypothetical protein